MDTSTTPSMLVITTIPFTMISATIFVVFVMLTVLMIIVDKKSKKFIFDEEGAVIARKAPSPMSLPILGNLYSMAGYELPYQSFGALEKRFGPIISLQLGQQPALVVNGIDNIKEVLIGKTSHFDSRPNFKRYHDLFSGNKENCKYIKASHYMFSNQSLKARDKCFQRVILIVSFSFFCSVGILRLVGFAENA